MRYRKTGLRGTGRGHRCHRCHPVTGQCSKHPIEEDSIETSWADADRSKQASRQNFFFFLFLFFFFWRVPYQSISTFKQDLSLCHRLSHRCVWCTTPRVLLSYFLALKPLFISLYASQPWCQQPCKAKPPLCEAADFPHPSGQKPHTASQLRECHNLTLGSPSVSKHPLCTSFGVPGAPGMRIRMRMKMGMGMRGHMAAQWLFRWGQVPPRTLHLLALIFTFRNTTAILLLPPGILH